jgi:periplasmic divalent cation tolerance protein
MARAPAVLFRANGFYRRVGFSRARNVRPQNTACALPGGAHSGYSAAMPLLAYTTLDDDHAARALARAAVAEKCAACVHIQPITSVYDWNGLQEDAEIRLMFKTSHAAWPALKSLVLRDHPYDEPALWAVEITDGAESFLGWIDATATGPKS